MWSAMAREWRIVRGSWLAWCLPFLVAGMSWLLLDANARVTERIAGTDPQGFEQQWEDYLSSGVQMYTSGFFAGQLLAMVFGALLVIRDRGGDRPVRRSKLAVAAAGGAVLGLTAVAVAGLLTGERATRNTSLGGLSHYGVPYDPLLLNHPGIWLAVAVGLLGFPLWAAAGVGFAARYGRGVLWYPAILLPGVAAYGVLERLHRYDLGSLYLVVILWVVVLTTPVILGTSNAFVVGLPYRPGWAVVAVLLMAMYPAAALWSARRLADRAGEDTLHEVPLEREEDEQRHRH